MKPEGSTDAGARYGFQARQDLRAIAMREFIKFAVMGSTVRRALKVALVITPILTVFNHFGEIRDFNLGVVFWFQVGLTFTVPYAVCTYSSAMAAMEEHRKSSA